MGAGAQRRRPVDTQSAQHRHSSDLRPPKPSKPEWPEGLAAEVKGEGRPSYRVTNADLKFWVWQEAAKKKKHEEKNPTNFKAREAAIL